MSIFFDSEHCTSRAACAPCRGADPRWRASLLAIYPDLAADWPCPHGVPWSAPRRTVAEASAIVLAMPDLGLAAALHAQLRAVDAAGKPCERERRGTMLVDMLQAFERQRKGPT